MAGLFVDERCSEVLSAGVPGVDGLGRKARVDEMADDESETSGVEEECPARYCIGMWVVRIGAGVECT